MTNEIYLTHSIILLLAAVMVVTLFRKLRVSSIVGYLMAGVLIGPHALGFISNSDTIQLLGQLGVVFLLFTLGLKMPLRRFQVLRRYVFGLGLMQVVLTTAALSGVAVWLGQSSQSALLIASALALSSTAVGLQLLSEQGELTQKVGRVSFAILLFQDLAVILLLMLLTTLIVPGKSILESLSAASLKAVSVLVGIVLFGRLILQPLFKAIASLQNAEIFTAVSLLIVLLTSLATDEAGLSKELGAFLAGLLLSETEYRHQVEADIQPFHGLLLGLFFMTVGMSIDLSLMVEKITLILGILAGLLVLKMVLLFLFCRLFKISTVTSIRVSMLLAAGGEFAFVILGPAVQQKLVTPDVAQLLYLTVAISMTLTPFLSMIGRRIADSLETQEADRNLATAAEEVDDLRNHVIMAGFGRIGKMIARILTDRQIPFVVIDNDMNRVLEGRSHGFPVFYGDATRDTVWKSLSADKAAAAVISLATPKATLKAALMVRRKFPKLDVSVRMTDDTYEQKLKQAGATVVKPENLEPSLQLASRVLECMGTHEIEILKIIENFRRTYASTHPADLLAAKNPSAEL